MSVSDVKKQSLIFTHEKLIIFVVCILALLGGRAYISTPQSIFPAISISRIDVVVDAGDLPPDQVDLAIGRPFEKAFQMLPAVTQVTTSASQGSAEFKVDFTEGTDPKLDLQYVNQAIAQVRSTVPQAQNIDAVAIAPNSEPVLSYALTSKTLSASVVRQLAIKTIAPRFYGIAGMGRLLVTGGSEAEFHVDLDAARLHAADLGVSDIVSSLSAQNSVQGVGMTDQFFQRYAVLVDTSLHDVPGLSAMLVPTKNAGAVALGSLGNIHLGIAPPTVETSYDGEHAIILNVYALPGTDTVRMAAAFNARLQQVEKELPRTIAIKNFWDQTTLITESQNALKDAIIIGALLAIAIIYLFLRSLRFTLIAAAIIPLAVSITLFFLQQGNQSLNLMSVGGLAVAVGLIIDDAIVVIENIARHRHEHANGNIDETIPTAMRQISGAMIASTLATVVVFLPLALLSGVSGFFFRALAFTLSTSLIVSLLLALFLAPIIARHLLRTEQMEHAHRDAISRILDRYEPVLRWSLNHRLIVAAGSIATLVLTAVLLSSLPSDFLPAMDEGQFEIAYTMPTGTTLAASDAAATTMERIVAHDSAVASVGRLTGIDSNGYSPTQENQGVLRVRLIDASHRDGFDVVSERLRKNLESAVPASLYDVHQILEDMINDLSGTTAPIAIALHGTDQQTLITLANKLAASLAKIPGIVDTASGVVYDNPSLRISPNIAALNALGLSVNDLANQAGALTQGVVATHIASGTTLMPVRVSITKTMPIQDVLRRSAHIDILRLKSDITTQNGQRTMLVTANLQGASLSSVTTAIDHVLKHMSLPPGYTTEIGGQIKTQQQSFAEFMTVIAIAIALVYAVMLATFRSFRLPVVILAAIPLALIGVATALKLSGTPFNISSFMGLLLLVGIVVKNGILLIDVANIRRAQGDSMIDALVTAGRTRLRPIVMTTLAAIGGLFPLALGIGQGAEMEKPLAIAVIGGLSTATIFTLIVIPVLYAAIASRQPLTKGPQPS